MSVQARIGKLLAFWVVCGTLAQCWAGPLWQRALFLEPSEGSLQVTEVFRCENDGSVAVTDGLRVHVPQSGIETVEVTMEESGGPPARAHLRKTGDTDVYSLRHRIGPGTTIFQVRYSVPGSTKFTGRAVDATHLRLVSRQGVTLSGDSVRFVAVEPHSQANIYELVNVGPEQTFAVSIGGLSETASSGRQPKRGPARILSKLSWLVGLQVSLLCIGGVLLYRQPRAKRTTVDKGLLLCFVVTLLALVQITRGGIAPRSAFVGEQAPNFSLRTDDGRNLRPASFGGKLLVINFWATWCQPCVAEMPGLKQFASEMEPEGVVVVAVSIDENEQAYRRFLNQLQPRFLTRRDAEGELASDFGTFKVPETYVIDRTGRVLQKYISSQDWMDPAIQREIHQFLLGVK